MNRLKVFFLFLMLIFSVSLSALDFQAVVLTDYFGDIEPSTDYDNIRSRLYFQPSLSADLFDYAVELELSANLFYQPIGDPELISPENILREAFVFIPFNDFDLILGQRIVTLGMTDVFSPLNCVNGDYVNKLSLDDPYDGKRADLMIQLQYYPTYDDSIQLIYIPFPRPDYEPDKTVSMTGPDLGIDISFDSDPYIFDGGHSFFMAYNHMSAGYDLQVAYGFYMEQTPNFDLSDLTFGTSLSGTASSVYTKNHIFGGAWSTSFSGLTLVEELAFNLTEDLSGINPGIKNSDITLNSQLTGTLPGNTFAQLNFIYQHVLNYDKSGTVYSEGIDELLNDEFNTYHTQPVQNIAFLIGHIHNSFFHEKLYLALNAGFFFSTDVYLAPRIAYALTDRMKIEAGADIKTGTYSRKFLARGNLMDNFFIRLKFEY